MIPEGTYAAVAVPVKIDGVEKWCQFGESDKKKTPYVVVMFEIIRGSEAGERIKWTGYFSDNDVATDRTIQSLRACGFTGDDLAAFMEQAVEFEVNIVVEHEEYKGRFYPKVQWVNAVSSGIKTENAMAPSALRTFSARLKTKVKAQGPIAGVKAVREAPSAAPVDQGDGFNQAPPDEPQPEPHDDTDIPF